MLAFTVNFSALMIQQQFFFSYHMYGEVFSYLFFSSKNVSMSSPLQTTDAVLRSSKYVLLRTKYMIRLTRNSEITHFSKDK